MLYPNPVNSVHTVESKETGFGRIIIYNINGQEVVSLQTMNAQKQVDVSLLPDGVYFVKVQYIKGVGVLKFIKN